jgi:FlaA1/EpsC-like NDP-sugar epimerase|tara:strand:+ start:2390 stop:3580 length:1191 start_codon:yes stop_codon:yes gene_type:complete
MNILSLISRNNKLFSNDIQNNLSELSDKIENGSFLILGAAGSIGQALSKQIFYRDPKKLHVVDINENNLVELVRDIRSSKGYIRGEFKTFALDIGSIEFDHYINSESHFDYVFNLSALKHVRSESDPFTLMRMINVNILNTIKTVEQSFNLLEAKKYFCVSTDKATNPVNMMGASKRIMEKYLIQLGNKIDISMARFANVAFSDGSLLHGFNQRIQKKQPISAPLDVKRYFVTSNEAGELCLLSGLLGKNREIFFPKLTKELNLISFDQIAKNYLKQLGYEPVICENEDEARRYFENPNNDGKWPCYFFQSDTTGEKDYEEFFTSKENIDFERYENIGVVESKLEFDDDILKYFLLKVDEMKRKKAWKKEEIVDLFNKMIPTFKHYETNKYLDDKM